MQERGDASEEIEKVGCELGERFFLTNRLVKIKSDLLYKYCNFLKVFCLDFNLKVSNIYLLKAKKKKQQLSD